jgi:hypothetical protein
MQQGCKDLIVKYTIRRRQMLCSGCDVCFKRKRNQKKVKKTKTKTNGRGKTLSNEAVKVNDERSNVGAAGCRLQTAMWL